MPQAEIFQGESIRVRRLDEGFVELCFDRQGDAINKFDKRTVRELGEATALIAGLADVRGVLVSSAKDVFIVGADINEFGGMFQLPEVELAKENMCSNEVFFAFEDLPVPSVVAINGYALGGGMELTMTTAYRVMSDTALIGLPEVKLGLFPGFGGTVRLPRIAGIDTAVEWIAYGKPAKAEAALAAGVVDEVCKPEALREVALGLLRCAAAGELDWRVRQAAKRAPLPLPASEVRSAFAAVRAEVAGRAAKHQPAALSAVELMEHAAGHDRLGAQTIECEYFARIAKTQAADSLVQTFHNEQALKKLFRRHATQGRPLKQAAVIGAGIMGGGIAYTSALRGTPVRLKDIAEEPLRLGMEEASKQLAKQVKGGRLSQDKADRILASIQPQLDFAGFERVDVLVEAVVENLELKRRVLSDLENRVGADTLIASNTSSLRIDDIAASLARPENFVGMHFFNPVPVMSLVEVIKGGRTSEMAVSTAVGYAVAMGKTPIVVKDCPGFLVNRILTPYIRGFLQLLADGADFVEVDRVMEAFGWPMGPAYLEDVVGMDTGSHVCDLISAGYAERMPVLERDALRLMVAKGRFGQKNGLGFYRYERDPAGRPKKFLAEDSHALLAEIQPHGTRAFDDQEIVERMMLPMLIEAAHALEEGVVATPAELDMALLLGIGFPAYLGGPLKYADWLGLDKVLRLSERYAHLGEQYRATERMREMAANGKTYYND